MVYLRPSIAMVEQNGKQVDIVGASNCGLLRGGLARRAQSYR